MSFCIKSLNIVFSKSDVRKVRELQSRFVAARNTKMFMDHVGDLSSLMKSIDFLGFLLLHVDRLLEVRVFVKIIFQVVAIVGMRFPCACKGRAQVVHILNCLNFANPRHGIRWMVRRVIHFCFFF